MRSSRMMSEQEVRVKVSQLETEAADEEAKIKEAELAIAKSRLKISKNAAERCRLYSQFFQDQPVKE